MVNNSSINRFAAVGFSGDRHGLSLVAFSGSNPLPEQV
jgi:hypothetical protein